MYDSEKPKTEVDIIAEIPGLLVVKDANLRVAAITHAAAILSGWNNIEDAIGCIDYDIPSQISASAADFLKLDKLAFTSSNDKLQTIHISSYEVGWKAILAERQVVKLKNGSKKLYISALDITNKNLLTGMFLIDKLNNKKFNLKNKQANYIIGYNHSSFLLTEKQELCLFLTLRGKTMKEIGAILDISTRTVEDYINILKDKLDCYSKSQLIEKAIDNGLFYHLPRSFLERIT